MNKIQEKMASPVEIVCTDVSDDLSTSCRDFYMSRKRKIDKMKKIHEKEKEKPKSKLDDLMCELRENMASLAERDMELMETMLRMNDTIHDIKTQSIDKCDSLSASQEVFSSSWLLNDVSVDETEKNKESEFIGRDSGISDNEQSENVEVFQKEKSPFLRKDSLGNLDFDPTTYMKNCHLQTHSIDSGYDQNSCVEAF